MIKPLRFKFITIALFLLVATIYLDAQVNIDGEIRIRSEFRQGFRKPLLDTLKPLFITFQRTRLNFDYKSKNLNSTIKIQDSRIWGESSIKQVESRLAIIEGWAEWVLDSTFSAKFGRQHLAYDDQRIFTSGDWNWGNSHDLLLFKYKPLKMFVVNLGLAYNNTLDTFMVQSYTIPKTYKTMGFLWVQKSFANGLKISGIAVEEGLQKINDFKTMYSRFTSGGNLIFQNDSSKLNFSALGYYQIGKNSSFLDLEAAMAAAKFSYKFYKSNSIFLAFDYNSGSKPEIMAGTTHTFNKLYGSNHSVNGNMEYWAVIPVAGLVDYFGGFSGQFSPKLNVSLTYHVFNFAQKCVVNNQELDKNIGSEFDLVLNYNFRKEITMQAGYCMYFASSSTKTYNGIVDATIHQPIWNYVMFTFKPNFYKTTQSK